MSISNSTPNNRVMFTKNSQFQSGKPLTFRSNLANIRNKFNNEGNYFNFNAKKNKIKDDLNLIEEQSSPQKSLRDQIDINKIQMGNYDFSDDIEYSAKSSLEQQPKKRCIDPFPAFQEQPQNIFTKDEFLDGFNKIPNKNLIDDSGNVIQRYIIGSKKMFLKQQKIQQEKLQQKGNNKMMASRFKKHKIGSITNDNITESNMDYSEKSNMGNSMNQSITSQRTNMRQQKNNLKQINQEVKSKQDLFKEMEEIRLRIENIKFQEKQDQRLGSKVAALQQSQQERILEKFNKQEQQWNKLQDYYSKKTHKKSNSIMDLEQLRKINEFRNKYENQSLQKQFNGSSNKWQYNLRKEIPTIKEMIPSKSANNLQQRYNDNEIISEPPKRKFSFKLQGDLPDGFRTSGHSLHFKQLEQARNPFSISQNYFALRNKSTSHYRPHETKHNFCSNDFINKDQQLFEPEFDGLYVQGQNQFQKELEMLQTTKQNFFKKKKLPDSVQQDQEENKDEQEIIEETYDAKTRAKKKQLDEIQSERLQLNFSKTHSVYNNFKSAQNSPNTKFGSTNCSKNAFYNDVQKQFNKTANWNEKQIYLQQSGISQAHKPLY